MLKRIRQQIILKWCYTGKIQALDTLVNQMSCWTILNLEPTTDEKQIRRAYAKILKTIDQDQEPARFIELRAALEQAQSWAAWQHEETDDEEELDDRAVQLPLDRRVEPTAISLMQTPNVSMVWHPPQIEIEASTWQTELSIEQPVQAIVDVPDREPTEQTWHERVDEIRQRMWADEWNGQLLMDLRVLLRDVQEQPLSVQIEVYESLSYPLSWADEDQDLTDFLTLFFQVFDAAQLDDSKAEEHEHKLFARYQQIKAKQDFWLECPDQYQSHLQALANPQRVELAKMWQLHRSQHRWVLKLHQQGWQLPDHSSLVHSANWQLLQLFPAQVLYVGLMAAYGALIFFYFVAIRDGTDDFVEGEKILLYLLLAAGLSMLWVWGWCLRVYAYWLAQPQNHQRPRWFLYVLLMSALVYLSVLFDVAEWIELTAAIGWAVAVLLWLGYYVMKPNAVSIFAWLHRISLGQISGVVMVVTVVLLLWGLVTLGFVWFHQPIDQQVWRSGLSGILMMMLPISLLFYRDAIWQDLKSGWQQRKPYTMQQKWLIGLSVCALGGLSPLLFAEHVWSVLGWLGMIVMIVTIPSKIMAYVIKYGFYGAAIAFCLVVGDARWLATVVAVYALFQVYGDFQLERTPKAA